MKKQKEKRLIIEEKSEKDLKYIGQIKYLRKNWWKTLLWVILCMTITIVVVEWMPVELDKGGWWRLAFALVMYFVIVIPPFIVYEKAGNKYWNDIKDKDQPIKL